MPHKPSVETKRVKPTDEHICAACGWTHADIKSGPNYFHKECKNMMDHEFHNPPPRIVQFNRSKE